MDDNPTTRLVEAIAWWKLGEPDAQKGLEEAAVQLLVAGDERKTVVELASMYPDINDFELEALVERTIVELDVGELLSINAAEIATRRVARMVISGTIPASELAWWAHKNFHYASDYDLLNELAFLDDDYDELEWLNKSVKKLDKRTLEIARLIASDSQFPVL